MKPVEPRARTISARILGAARAGKRPSVIGSEIGVDSAYVCAVLTKLRKRGLDVPQFAPTPPRIAPRGRKLAAKARGLSIPQLVERLLTVLDEDPDIAAAILDDNVLVKGSGK